MIHDLGPRTRRIFELLQDRIRSGELPPGTRLPAHARLAAEFGVAPMTMRHVLARLEQAGLVSRELGRGTFVRGLAARSVLVLAGPPVAAVLAEHVRQAGEHVLSLAGSEEALAALRADPTVALVLAELGPHAPLGGADFVRAVRRRWPTLPLAVLIASPADLTGLHATAECPLLLLPTPVRPAQLDELLHLVFPDGDGQRGAEPAADGVLDEVTPALLRRMADAALVLDRASRRVVDWNPAAAALLGYSAAPAVGLTVEELVPERVQAELRARLRPAVGSPGDPLLDASTPLELPLVGAGGREVWVELTASALADRFVLLVLRDRSGQRAVQDTLSFQARLLEAVEQAVVATDPSGRIIYWNRGAERLYGWRAEEVLGGNVGEVIVAPELLARGREIMERLRQGESWSGEFPVCRRDGTAIPVLVTDSPVRDEDGRLVGIIGVAADLSERKRAERDRLERARLEARLRATQAAQRELSQRLARHVPEVGQLAGDPRLPPPLRPIAGVVMEAVREVASQLQQPPALGED